jgi:hypothetical protein
MNASLAAAFAGPWLSATAPRSDFWPLASDLWMVPAKAANGVMRIENESKQTRKTFRLVGFDSRDKLFTELLP